MENINQDAMLHAQPEPSGTDTGGPMQIPDQTNMLNDDDNGDPTGTLGITETASTGTPSGSPNMEPDSDSGGGTGESIGNNDGTEVSPESADEEFLK
ncbi:MAG: hypothetical protein H7Z72_18675 [Bacteroidetes bacterium]|nr:hypothetical protein [Fibrella sp.]